MSQVRLPAKTTIRVDALIASTLKTIQGATTDSSPAPIANSALTGFVESLAQTLLSSEQQQQVKTILDLWKTCRCSSNNTIGRTDNSSSPYSPQQV